MPIPTDYQDLAQIHGIPVDSFPLDKSQIMHALRRFQEAAHRKKTYHHSALGTWVNTPFHNPIEFDRLSGLRLEDADESCNRTAPIFVLRHNSYPEDGSLRALPGFNLIPSPVQVDIPAMQVRALLSHMHNYIYQRWFRPYKSEVDRGQFLTKVHLPSASPLPSPTCSLAMVDLVRKMSANLVARIKHVKSQETSLEEEEANQVFYYLQPTFEAIAMSIRAVNFNYEAPDVANLPVLIVRTGVEQGLSAPITLDTIPAAERINECSDSNGALVAIETRLEMAVTFLIELEQREAEATAISPLLDLTLVTKDMTKDVVGNEVAWAAKRLGWDAATMGALNGPSSGWADPDKYKDWSDNRQRLDEFYLQQAQMTRHAKLQMRKLEAMDAERVARSQTQKFPEC